MVVHQKNLMAPYYFSCNVKDKLMGGHPMLFSLFALNFVLGLLFN
jgi:hypothetical protein